MVSRETGWKQIGYPQRFLREALGEEKAESYRQQHLTANDGYHIMSQSKTQLRLLRVLQADFPAVAGGQLAAGAHGA